MQASGFFIMADTTQQELTCVYDPLKEFMAHYADAKSVSSATSSYEGMTVEERLKKRIIDGDKIAIDTDLTEALGNYKALEIINDILLGGMKVVGELFGSGEMQLPFVLQSAETMKTAVKYLEPYMDKADGDGSKGKMVLATVKGDVHDIGKNLVDIILTNNGYTVYNLGIKVALEPMLEEFERQKADAIGMSGLLVKSTAIMKENLEVMAGRGMAIPVVLGGAALTRKFVEKDLREIYSGSLAYAQDAFDGLRFMEQLKGAAGGAIEAKEEKKPETVAEMIAAMKRSRGELLRLIEPLEQTDFDLEKTFNKWSLRDVLVHMIGWEEIATERIAILKIGGIPEAIDGNDADQWNARFVADSPLRGKEEILDEMLRVREALVGELEGLSEDAFLRKDKIPAAKKWLPYFTYAHEEEHSERIRQWLDSREEELDTATGLEGKMALAERALPWLVGGSQTLKAKSQNKEEVGVTRLTDIPTPPFWGVELRELWILDKVWEYINEVALFRGQWQLKRGKKTTEEHKALLESVARPKLNELKLLVKQQHILQPKAVYGYFPCWSEGDDVVILRPKSLLKEELIGKWDTLISTDLHQLIEYERFTFPRQQSGKKLCIADFFLSKEEAQNLGRPDVISMSAVTVGRKASEFTAKLFESNQYADYLYLHGLSVETAEALAEYLHKLVRMELGIAGGDAEEVTRLFSQGYQGSRYSFGYPACPELADQTKLFKLLHPERINMGLTEEYHLEPEQSTTAIICHHPEARYFGIR
jgi:cobalamin-dependent methionine synthase I